MLMGVHVKKGQLHPIVNVKGLKCEIFNIVESKSMLTGSGYLDSTNS